MDGGGDGGPLQYSWGYFMVFVPVLMELVVEGGGGESRITVMVSA